MNKLLLMTGLIAAMAPVVAGPSFAGTRNFFQPTVGGDRLSFCTRPGDDCGKPIADAWCRAIGFEEALNFQRERARGDAVLVARYADTGGLCRGKDCQTFRQIKCWSGVR